MPRWEGRVKPVPKRWHWASCISHLEMQILLLQCVLILHAQTRLMGPLISKKVVTLVNPNHHSTQLWLTIPKPRLSYPGFPLWYLREHQTSLQLFAWRPHFILGCLLPSPETHRPDWSTSNRTLCSSKEWDLHANAFPLAITKWVRVVWKASKSTRCGTGTEDGILGLSTQQQRCSQ